MGWVDIELPGADIALDADWMPRAEADALLAALVSGLPWTVHRIRMFGRLVDSPRLSCWIGDPDASYTYSGTRFKPHPWPALLVPIRERVSAASGEEFNSVLGNLYRDGHDSMGWHRDNEPELGPNPVIASLSLGAARRFLLKRAADMSSESQRREHVARATRGKDPCASVALELRNGSLMVMRGPTQCNYRHALPRAARVVEARVNLTFRRVVRE